MARPPPGFALFPYTTLFRSPQRCRLASGDRGDSNTWGLLSAGSSLWALDPRGDDPAESRPQVLESRSEEHTSELQSRGHLVCRLLLEKKKIVQTVPPVAVMS